MGTATPSSFFCQDVAAWLSRDSCTEEAGVPSGLGTGGLGSVRIGRLRWGKQGPVARHSIQDGFVEVRVDRHGSHVGNPFAGAPVAQLCRAYDELLRAVLTTPLLIDECLHEYEGLRQDSSFGTALLTLFEEKLLQTIAEKHKVRVHEQRFRPTAVRAWLVYHSSLIVQGKSLYLFCWCTHGGWHTPPWTCHSQSLMGALLWVSSTFYQRLLPATFRTVSSSVEPQVLLCPTF